MGLLFDLKVFQQQFAKGKTGERGSNRENGYSKGFLLFSAVYIHFAGICVHKHLYSHIYTYVYTGNE